MTRRPPDDIQFLLFIGVIGAMIVIVVAAAKVFSAPVPTHLFPPPPPDPIAPGYRWRFKHYELEVVAVYGDLVTYRCRNVPGMVWSPNGICGQSIQPKATTIAEANAYGGPPEPGTNRWLYGE